MVRRMGFKNAILSIVLVCACFGRVFAAYPLATDDAGTVSHNSFELEAGYANAKDHDNLTNQASAFSFKHGVTERLDVGIAVPYQIKPSRGERMGAATMVFKFSLVRDMVAMTFSNELGEKAYFLNAIYTKEFPGIKLNFNAGYLSTATKLKRELVLTAWPLSTRWVNMRRSVRCRERKVEKGMPYWGSGTI
jgi:hypothetical protein